MLNFYEVVAIQFGIVFFVSLVIFLLEVNRVLSDSKTEILCFLCAIVTIPIICGTLEFFDVKNKEKQYPCLTEKSLCEIVDAQDNFYNIEIDTSPKGNNCYDTTVTYSFRRFYKDKAEDFIEQFAKNLKPHIEKPECLEQLN